MKIGWHLLDKIHHEGSILHRASRGNVRIRTMIPLKSLRYLFVKLLKPLLVIVLFVVGMSCVFYPWAVPLPGRAKLSGGWMGPIHSSEGPEGWLFLKLEPRPTLAAPWTLVSGSKQYNSKAGSRLQGEARLCTGPLGRVDLEIDGYTTA